MYYSLIILRFKEVCDGFNSTVSMKKSALFSFPSLLLLGVLSLSTLSAWSCDDGYCLHDDSDDPEKARYEKIDFHPPMGIPLYLAGNFCELRSNHFHTGLDIKTGGVIGKRIYAIEEGYVSRVKVGLWGYGKVIYVTHPNGYTSVYAHLNKFNDEIEAFIKKAQYMKEKYEIELFPGKDQLKVDRGELIAISGNSGSSTAPHLHFEIRESGSEKPVNPLLFNFDIKDNVKPVIRYFRIYPLTDSSFVSDKSRAASYKVGGSSGTYTAKDASPIKVHGEIGFAIDVVDKLNGAPNICGTYTIELFVDGEQVFGQRLEKMNFAVNRYINAHMDYELWKKESRHFQRSYLLPNNKLPIYENVKNRGVVKFTDNEVHAIRYVVKDVYGNESTLSFKVQSDAKPNYEALVKPASASFAQVKHNEAYALQQEEFAMLMPPDILYDDLDLQFSTASSPKYALAPLYKIHNKYTPLQSYFTVKFKADSAMQANASKCIIVSINDAGRIYNEKGKFEDGWISTRTRSFGNYTVMMDKTKPVITPQNISDGKDMSKNTQISIKMTDNLSGVRSWRGTIDGKWVLFEYDPQRAKAWYVFDDRIGPGKHKLKFTVRDERGNRSTYEAEFTR